MPTGLLGLRKPFLWPLALLSLSGFLMAIVLPDVRAISVGLVLVGIATAGGGAALVTLLMELPGMTPAKMGTAFAIIWAVAYAGAFFSPIVGGMLVPSLGLRDVLLIGLIFQVLPITSMYLLAETGSGRWRVVSSSSTQLSPADS